MSNIYHPLGMGEDVSEAEYQRMYGPDDANSPDDGGPSIVWPAHLNAPEGLWQTKDGTTTRIREGMTDKHLRNAIQWMKDRALDGHPKYRELIAERKRRGRK